MSDFTSPAGTPIAWEGPKTPAVRRALDRAGLHRTVTGADPEGYWTVKPRDVAYVEVHVPLAQKESARAALLAAGLVAEDDNHGNPTMLVAFAPA